MSRSASHIILPDDPEYVQLSLLPPEIVSGGFPPILRDIEGFKRILTDETGDIGLDLEFSSKTERPSVLGIASRNLACAVPWDKDLMRMAIAYGPEKGRMFVGHSVLGADRPVVEGATGISTPLHWWKDSMITHYLNNADMAKAPDKDPDSDDAGSLGFMNLWTAASMVTEVRNWKACQGIQCPQEICPRHDVWGYCAVDSWAGLIIHEENYKELQRYGVPDSFYLDMMELGEICNKMERRGLAVDREKVARLRKEMAEQKDAIFEYELIGGKKVYKRFNPAANEQSIKWFHERGVALEKNDKKTIRQALDKQLERCGYASIDEAQNQEELPEVLDALLNLHEFKESGKGPDPWFADKYFGSDELIHPRFIITGASSGRLASSKPNFQNIGKRGWAKMLKSCVIPRNPDCDFIASDSSQLELRIVLWLSGLDPSLANGIFEALVQESNGAYTKAAELGHQSERDIAKRVVHASDYLEGFTLLSGKDLMRPQIKQEIDCGALRIYSDWEYCGKTVAFTGSNLADTLFGTHDKDSRKIANTLREQYLARFPQLLEWQKKSLAFVESHNYIQLPTGRFLRLYGSERDNAKIAIATQGQGGGADYIQGVMLRFYRETGEIPDLNVHDELTFEIPKSWSDAKAKDFISLMYEETPRMPGFSAPGKAARGPNYGEKKEI